MSKRIKIGDEVWVRLGAGFGVSRGEWGTISDSQGNRETPWPCPLCENDCIEWSDICLDSGRMVYHVSECEIADKEVNRETR